MPHADLPVSDRRTDALVRSIDAVAEGPIDWGRVFGNDGPVEVEIGVGKGRFLLLAASARPDTNFLGIEYARKYAEKAVDRVAKRALVNVRVVHAEAVEFMRDRISDGSLAAVHAYFPDPWPKKRHHKRRFFRKETLDVLSRVLAPGGRLLAATDHDDYAAVIEETVGEHAAFETCLAAPGSEQAVIVPEFDELTAGGVTNFEIKYRREGRTIHGFSWKRRDERKR